MVSLVPVEARIDDRFETVFSDDPAETDVPVDLEEEEEIEPFEGGTIDIGEATVQQMAVRIDPYPRAPGAAIPQRYRTDAEGEAQGNRPFERLAPLGRRK